MIDFAYPFWVMSHRWISHVTRHNYASGPIFQISVLQYHAVSCSVMQCVLQRVNEWCHEPLLKTHLVDKCVVECCSVLQRSVVCYSVLTCHATKYFSTSIVQISMLQCAAAWLCVVRFVTVCLWVIPRSTSRNQSWGCVCCSALWCH